MTHRSLALLLAMGAAAFFPSDAHAQKIPWIVLPLVASPIVAVWASVVALALTSHAVVDRAACFSSDEGTLWGLTPRASGRVEAVPWLRNDHRRARRNASVRHHDEPSGAVGANRLRNCERCRDRQGFLRESKVDREFHGHPRARRVVMVGHLACL